MNSSEHSATLAVEVKDARLSYGRGKKEFLALQGINLNVPEGVIYGLLGPSGCGKTTLLCTVVGRRKLKHGQVKVFGTTPGSKEALVPGKLVGFMPQELSLYPEFTIEETLTFFGRLHRINPETLQERTAFLLKFLDLPKKSRLVDHLSGGQKRRVSFAAALIHSPPLLILDEPTVGVDPLLRKNIWNYLVKLTATEGMTVVITTHYIEEARQANMVGLMRHGRLLAEDCPDSLMSRFNEPTLEDCFLKLCLWDKDNVNSDNNNWNDVSDQHQKVFPVTELNKNNFNCHGNDKLNSSASLDNWDEHSQELGILNFNANKYSQDTGEVERNTFSSRTVVQGEPSNWVVDNLVKTYALTSKNMTRLRRNITVVLFQFALPAIQVILLCLCIGRPPFNLPVATVNHEESTGLGQIFLQNLDSHTIDQRVFNDTDAAIRSTKDGSTWGVIEIGKNFTASLIRRYAMGLEADNVTIDGSSIMVLLDMTNQQIGMTLQGRLLESFQEFTREVLKGIGAGPRAAQFPIVFGKPIFGSSDPRFTEFIAPGVILSITYIMAVGLTALSFVEERKSGLFERSWVSGVTSLQILVSHMITQSAVLVIQVSGLLIFTFLVFDIPSRGPFILVILMTLLQGATGMSFGLLISALVTQEATAIMIALGSFYPNLIMSGIVWPTQGMHPILRLFSYCLPQTLATESLRAILSRGWGLSFNIVWSGFLVSLAWLIFFLIAAGAIFRLRR